MDADESKTVSTFFSTMVNYITSKPILIPSPSSPRLIRLESELIEKVLFNSEQMNPETMVNLTLLMGHFSSCVSILSHLEECPTLLCLAAIDHMTSTQLTQIQLDFVESLELLARTRIEEHFGQMNKDADFGLESKWTCTSKILSPIVLGSINRHDLISTLLKDQIKSILELLQKSNVGAPEPGKV